MLEVARKLSKTWMDCASRGGSRGAREDRYGHSEDNREQVQGHDPDLDNTRISGSVKGAATHGPGDVSKTLTTNLPLNTQANFQSIVYIFSLQDISVR